MMKRKNSFNSNNQGMIPTSIQNSLIKIKILLKKKLKEKSELRIPKEI